MRARIRRQLVEKKFVSRAHHAFDDKSAWSIIEKLPTCWPQFNEVHGLAENKWKKFGKQLIDLIADFAARTPALQEKYAKSLAEVRTLARSAARSCARSVCRSSWPCARCQSTLSTA